jgi:hypothetical protein
MNDKEHYLEENVARLIQAGLGKEARLDPFARERTRQSLLAQFQKEQATGTFSDRRLVTLAGILVFMAVWLGIQTLGAGEPVTESIPLLIVAVVLTLNLALIPVAAIIIIIRERRRYA